MKVSLGVTRLGGQPGLLYILGLDAAHLDVLFNAFNCNYTLQRKEFEVCSLIVYAIVAFVLYSCIIQAIRLLYCQGVAFG